MPIRGAAVANAALLALALTACAGSSAAHARAPSRASSTVPSTTTTATTAAELRVTAHAASWRLPTPSARAVLLPDGSNLLLLGGLTSSGNTDRVLRIDPATGASTTVGALALGVHDAAGARLGAGAFVFGGGASAESDFVQRFTASKTAATVGRLPIPRSDLSAAVVGDRAYVAGGFDGARLRASTLSTANGVTFAVLGDLPVPVRYGAAVASGTDVLLFGGVTSTTDSAAADTSVVQSLDTTTGTVHVVAFLPHTLSHASAVVLRGHVYVLGGRWAGSPSAQVWRWEPTAHTLVPVAMLPTPLTDSAATAVGGVAYLAGGDAPRPTDAVAVVEVR
jgi:hypothetical protein